MARDRNVAPSTQNQALNALVFLYKQVLKQPLNEKINAERAARKVKIPVVLTRDETKRIIGAMTGIHQLVVKLLYGSGLRIIECLRLRVHDIDFDMNYERKKDTFNSVKKISGWLSIVNYRTKKF